MTIPFGIKIFRNEGCNSYLLWDRKTLRALLIDPTTELMDEYREFLGEHRFKLTYALDTHTHADHFSATQMLRTEYSADIGMSALTQSLRSTHPLKHGDLIQFDAISLQALATPGHTPDSICFFGHGLVFTGDTLFIGSSGRTDFPGADPAQQWESIHKVLGSLPDSTIVLPGHDYGNHIFSTLGVEKKKNPHLLLPSQETFVLMKNQETVQTSKDEIKKRIEFNLAPSELKTVSSSSSGTACGVMSRENSGFSSISIQKFVSHLEAHEKTSLFVDVREADEFQAGHIPKLCNFPLSELLFHLDELSSVKRIYVSCLSGRRSALAANTLAYLGLSDVVNVEGGFQAWSQAGFQIIR